MSDPYTLSLVDTDGKVVAQTQAGAPTPPTSCGPNLVADLPFPVSTSNSRVYFMDKQGTIRSLTPQGAISQVTAVPLGSSRYSTFSVSPDDRRIAVIVSDYIVGGATQRIYVEDLNGGTNHVDIFSATSGSGLWPIGWHAGNLVVAKVDICLPAGFDTCRCGIQELHVVDPATANRRSTVGSPQCPLVGYPSTAGAVCEDTAYTRADVLDWSGAVIRSIPIQRYEQAWLSPDGSRVAIDINAVTTTLDPAPRVLQLYACEWIDSTHLMSGVGNPVVVADIDTGKTVPVAADGQCAGRIPGGL